jgi:hypothetical protein
LRKDPEKGKEAETPSNIKEIQEIQGGQEAPHNGGAISCWKFESVGGEHLLKQNLTSTTFQCLPFSRA